MKVNECEYHIGQLYCRGIGCSKPSICSCFSLRSDFAPRVSYPDGAGRKPKPVEPTESDYVRNERPVDNCPMRLLLQSCKITPKVSTLEMVTA